MVDRDRLPTVGHSNVQARLICDDRPGSGLAPFATRKLNRELTIAA